MQEIKNEFIFEHRSHKKKFTPDFCSHWKILKSVPRAILSPNTDLVLNTYYAAHCQGKIFCMAVWGWKQLENDFLHYLRSEVCRKSKTSSFSNTEAIKKFTPDFCSHWKILKSVPRAILSPNTDLVLNTYYAAHCQGKIFCMAVWGWKQLENDFLHYLRSEVCRKSKTSSFSNTEAIKKIHPWLLLTLKNP